MTKGSQFAHAIKTHLLLTLSLPTTGSVLMVSIEMQSPKMHWDPFLSSVWLSCHYWVKRNYFFFLLDIWEMTPLCFCYCIVHKVCIYYCLMIPTHNIPLDRLGRAGIVIPIDRWEAEARRGLVTCLILWYTPSHKLGFKPRPSES